MPHELQKVSENLRCQLERAYQLKLAEGKVNSNEVYVPECNATDGSYAIVQACSYLLN